MKSKKLNAPAKLEVQSTAPSYAVSESGTFREGEIAIGKKGLLVSGQSPKLNLLPKLREDASAPKPQVSPQFDTSQSYESFLLELELKDLKFMEVLGKGSSGTVHKAVHTPSGRVIAVKVIPLDVKENVRKQIILELKTLHKTHCDFVVTFYDAFYNEGSIFIALEFMDAGSLADILTKAGTIPENVIASVALQILKGLNYLHKKLHLIHRDIKPSNLLINKKGQVKISDFGVSGQLAHTLSQCVSWVGTVTYMSPERISGSSYSYDSDLWSVGLSLVECAIGRFPYPKDPQERQSTMGFWEVLDYIVKEPPPTLPPNKFSKEFSSFVEQCLQKTPEDRPSASSLLEHPWIKMFENDTTAALWMQKWIQIAK